MYMRWPTPLATINYETSYGIDPGMQERTEQWKPKQVCTKIQGSMVHQFLCHYFYHQMVIISYPQSPTVGPHS
jgi:hypothetical protein